VVSFRDILDIQSHGLKRFETSFLRHLRQLLKRETISLFAKTLSDIIEGKDFEIIHCHDAMATWAALRVRENSRVTFKIVSTVHGPVSRHMIEEGYEKDSADVKKVMKCEREAWVGADAIIAVDEGQAEIAKSQGGDSEKIIVIPNAVDINQIEKIATTLPIKKKDERPWILVPRRLSPKNGIEFAIRALHLIKSRPRLLLAGNGLDKERLEALVVQLNLEKDVIFLGGLEHAVLLPIMAVSDLVVIPSVPIHGIEEATSIAALEAMAFYRPVIASNIGGLKLLFQDGKNGILVPPADSAKLAEKIMQILSDRNKAETIGQYARKTVEEKFSVNLWFDKHIEVYSNLF